MIMVIVLCQVTRCCAFYCKALPARFTREQVAHRSQIEVELCAQDHMLQQAAHIGAMLDDSANGHFYVCGDAKNMAKDVHRMLHTILKHHKVCNLSVHR